MTDLLKEFSQWLETVPFWQIIVGGYFVLFCTLLLNFADYSISSKQKFFRSGLLSAALMIVVLVASFSVGGAIDG